ncbi:MAG: hypothetical protein LBG22_00430 [Treponema sp.]|nr:hypothetical protein [Treponema sp.]
MRRAIQKELEDPIFHADT